MRNSRDKKHRLSLKAAVIVVIGLIGFGFSASPVLTQTADDSTPFVGRWSGDLSGQSVVLEIFADDGNLNVTGWFSGVKQNLEVLGYKPSIGYYLFRKEDKAAICLFFEDDKLILSYFEKDSVRRVVMSPV